MTIARRGARWWQRALLVAGQLAILPVGFFLAYKVTDYLDSLQTIPRDVLVWVFVGGVMLSVGALFVVLRKTRRWKFQYDVDNWWVEREERRLHPKWRKWRRVAWGVLLCVPSGIAAFVLFFLPEVTHVAMQLVFPRAGQMERHQVALPWEWMIVPPRYTRNLEVIIGRKKVGQFGFWNGAEVYDDGTVVFVERASENLFAILEEKNGRGEYLVENASRREFVLGKSTLTCWEFRWAAWPAGTHWEVRCTTPPEEGGRGFSAFYVGSREDIPEFYEVVGKVTVVE